MESKVNFAAVGAFVIVLGAACVAGVLWLGSGLTARAKTDSFVALVDDSVAGLNVDAPVKYRGVDVGKVSEIRISPDNPEQVRLVFAIERGTPIKADTEAMLKTQGLTGIAYVELSGGTRESPPLQPTAAPPYPEIRTKPSLSTRLEHILTTVLAKLESTSSNLNALLSDENRAAVGSALADLSAVARTIAQRKDALDAGIASAARTLENSARVSEQLGPALERIARSADAVQAMAHEARGASERAASTIDTVGADVRRLTAQTAPEVDRLLGEMHALAISLRRLSEHIERSPGGVLFGRRPPAPGPGEQAAK